ncbi:hypothetical protein DICA2_A03136 [Diutina catenulata]
METLSADTLAQLRVDLIGNKDLKHTVVADTATTRQIIASVTATLGEVTAAARSHRPPAPDAAARLASLLVVTTLLLNSSSAASPAPLAPFFGVVPSVIEGLAVAPALAEHPGAVDVVQFVNYSVDILVLLANHARLPVGRHLPALLGFIEHSVAAWSDRQARGAHGASHSAHSAHGDGNAHGSNTYGGNTHGSNTHGSNNTPGHSTTAFASTNSYTNASSSSDFPTSDITASDFGVSEYTSDFASDFTSSSSSSSPSGPSPSLRALALVPITVEAGPDPAWGPVVAALTAALARASSAADAAALATAWCQVHLAGAAQHPHLPPATLRRVLRWCRSSHPQLAVAAVNAVAAAAPAEVEPLFPTLVTLMRSVHPVPRHLLSPFRVLGDCCKRSPQLAVQLKQTNLDLALVEMLSARLAADPLLQGLYSVKRAAVAASGPATFVDWSRVGLFKKHPQFDPSGGDLLLLLSVYTYSNEDNRSRLCSAPEKCQFSRMLFDLVDLHLFCVNQVRLGYKLVESGRGGGGGRASGGSGGGSGGRRASGGGSGGRGGGRGSGASASGNAGGAGNAGASNSGASNSGATGNPDTGISGGNSGGNFGNSGGNSGAGNAGIIGNSSSIGSTGVSGNSGSGSTVSGALTPGSAASLGAMLGIVDSPLFTHAYYLIRSLSRSITPLRTFFVECNAYPSFMGAADGADGLVTNLLELLKVFETQRPLLKFFGSPTHAAMVNQSVVLAVLANFITEFSSFKSLISNSDTFLPSLSVIFAANAGPSYQQTFLQLNVLYVLKNLLFVDTDDNKREVWHYFSLEDIVAKTSYGLVRENVSQDPEVHAVLVQQKLVSFSILQNLTAGSAFYPVIVEAYDSFYAKLGRAGQRQLPSRWNDYLLASLEAVAVFVDPHLPEVDETDVEMWLLENSKPYVKLVTTITKMESNRYKDTVDTPNAPFPDDAMLAVWLRLLKCHVRGHPDDSGTGVENVNDVKLSILRLLMNLVSKEQAYPGATAAVTDYNLFETVQRQGDHGSYSASSRFSLPTRALVHSSSPRPAPPPPEDRVATPAEERARYLEEFGFLEVVTELIAYFNERERGKKFSIRNCHDLVERLSQLQHQMEILLYHRAPSASVTPQVNAHTVEAIKPMQPPGPDVNRGGEGFGYDDDDDVDEAGDDDEDDDERMMRSINEELEEARETWLI